MVTAVTAEAAVSGKFEVNRLMDCVVLLIVVKRLGRVQQCFS